jgi:acetyl-CoA carboxylase biotin carboxyl carrier protein
MNLKELKELIELVSEKGFTEFEIERQGFRMRICRTKEPAAQLLPSTATPLIVPTPISVSHDLSAAARETPVETASLSTSASSAARTAERAEPPADDSELQIIKSPIVGTFYRAPSPNSEPFVKIGDHVEQDTVVCIIEAMKLMNEIQSEMSGEIMKIFAENGQPVEYGQPLFGIKT